MNEQEMALDTLLSDEQLVALSRSGRNEAFGLLVERHRPGTARLLAPFANLIEVEDILQESFLQAYLNLNQLRQPTRFAAWVGQIARNLGRMALRATPSLSELDDEVPAGELSPESDLEQRDMDDQLALAMATLPPAEREAIEQVYWYGLSQPEAARRLNIKLNTLRTRLSRGRHRLQVQLNPIYPTLMEMKMIEMYVENVYASLSNAAHLDPNWYPTTLEQFRELADQVGPHRLLWLRAKEGPAALCVWLGPAEADAIVVQLKAMSVPRPLTFDLMKNIMEQHHIQLEQVAIHKLHEQVFYATLTLTQGQTVDCRPSDAINLALRMNAPIYVAQPVLDKSGLWPDPAGTYTRPGLNGYTWHSLLNDPIFDPFV